MERMPSYKIPRKYPQIDNNIWVKKKATPREFLKNYTINSEKRKPRSH